MGWSFSYSQTMEELVKERLADRSYTNDKGQTVHARTVAHSKRGNNLWYVVELTTVLDATAKTIKRYLALDLLSNGKRHGMGAGYKDLCETMGPREVNCPLYLLDLVPVPTEYGYAVEWRERVRAYHASSREDRKKAKEIQYNVGQRWELKEGLTSKGGKVPLYSVTLTAPNYSRSSVVGICNNGEVYRIPKKWLVRELLGEKEIPARQMMAELAQG